jgi:hypothetical protein
VLVLVRKVEKTNTVRFHDILLSWLFFYLFRGLKTGFGIFLFCFTLAFCFNFLIFRAFVLL